GAVLGDRLAVERAAGFAEPPREALGLVEYVVRQRNRSLHTRSITIPATAPGVLLAHSAGPAISPSIFAPQNDGKSNHRNSERPGARDDELAVSARARAIASPRAPAVCGAASRELRRAIDSLKLLLGKKREHRLPERGAVRRQPAPDVRRHVRLAAAAARVLALDVHDVAVVEDGHLRREAGPPRQLAHRGPADLPH